jgi:hypothetical protein
LHCICIEIALYLHNCFYAIVMQIRCICNAKWLTLLLSNAILMQVYANIMQMGILTYLHYKCILFVDQFYANVMQIQCKYNAY